jgi:hypothetical protein
MDSFSGSKVLPGRVNRNTCVLRALDKDISSRIPPPEIFRQKRKLNKINNAIFEVTYIGFESFPQAKTAYEYAISIWASLLTSNVPIRVYAIFQSLDSNILGIEDSKEVWDGFYNQIHANTYYPIALAQMLHGERISTGSPYDIKTTFNSDFRSWYFGTDGLVPKGKYDFVSVVVHELCHGLGFWCSMNITDSLGGWGLNKGYGVKPVIFDHFIFNGYNQKLIDTVLFFNPSIDLANQLQGNDIYFNGLNAIFKNNGLKPKLYAPMKWVDGTSISHLDENTYPAGNQNSLMTPLLAGAESIHSPGPLILGILKDLGWKIDEPTNDVSEDGDREIQQSYNLFQNFPNPFNFSTVIRFELPKPGYVSLKVLSTAGKEVAPLISQTLAAGKYAINWNVNSNSGRFASGVYFCELRTENFISLKKMILLK